MNQAVPKILIIDDSEEVLEALSTFLEISGYEVFKTTRARDGIDLFGDVEPNLVITDMMMPEMDGSEAIKAIKSKNPDAPIFAISGGGERYITQEYALNLANAFGANEVLTKPVDPNSLLELIAKYIN